MVRTPCCDKSGLKKGTWTPEEDRKLIAYVTRYGCWNWRQLPRFAGLQRCGKSCRLRWMNYLRPNIKRGNYTKEEEETIIKLHASLGNRWSMIASRLPGRSDNEIKNHWHTHLKKRTKMKPKQYLQLDKELSSESSQCETFTNNRESEAESSTAADPNIDHDHQVLSHQILEASQSSSPEETTSNMNNECLSLSPSNSNNDYVPTLTAIDCLPSEDIFIGDFWTEPFVQDDTYNEYHPTYFLEGGGLILPNAYFFYDDGAIDL
ncbi:hypothetical protein FNV43_RR13502 [Rhamnella rubrinervis]|uniref:Uncharacterized protein n=1 Tax=Rhamnella rubrinervis TaxID=2594499 RepID=A0A8K0MFB2_9ROSA|nr:hypothetical protein FNV43_RR13502 [Rhamnella rubrinervis]